MNITMPGAQIIDFDGDDAAPEAPFPCPVISNNGHRCAGTMRLNRSDLWECDACHRQAAGQGALLVHKDATLVKVDAGEIWLYPITELGDGDFQT